MKKMWVGSEISNVFKDEIIYERETYCTVDAKPFKIKKVWLTFLAEDEDGNEKELKVHDITTESKESIIMYLREFGHEVVEKQNHIILNPKTDAEEIDLFEINNNILFMEGHNCASYAIKTATQIHDELVRYREWVKDEEDRENGIGIYAEDDDDDEDKED